MLIAFTIHDLRTDPATQDKLFDFLAARYPVKSLKTDMIGKILRYLSGYRADLAVVAEDRYIDKVYRNSFSHYYSTKLNIYPEYCVRLSFLEPNVDFSNREDILAKYLGFMVLRPIDPGVVGRTAVRPQALTNGNEIMICKSRIRSSILGNKAFIDAFPHSSQDSEYSTCAETSIWSLMEYFGNKYPEYNPILPSQIHEILDRKAHERHIPSHGLKYFDISYVLKNRGFGTMNYNIFRTNIAIQDDVYKKFRRTFSTYIESGIPLGVAITSLPGKKPFGHAVVCVGRKKIDRALIAVAPLEAKNGKNYRRWSDVPTEFIFNDDNVGAYQLTGFDDPAPQHGRSDLYISNIIVPLYNRIYLDAPRATFLSEDFCTGKLSLPDKVIFRTYLASGNTYMNYIMSDPVLSDKYKSVLFRLVRLPKFIWVTEISTEGKFVSEEVEGVLILDATEPYKIGVVYPLFAAYKNENYFYDYESEKCLKNSIPLQFESKSFNNLA